MQWQVYAAMAQSLGLAWSNLNAMLEQRKSLLDQNYMFQGHFQVGQDLVSPKKLKFYLLSTHQDYLDKVSQLEATCCRSTSVTDVEDMRKVISLLNIPAPT